MKGIDVSAWQGDINWSKVAQSGIGFAMVRASYGTNQIDKKFVRNMNGISGTGINPGAYHYTYATSVSEARAEAENFLNTIGPYSFYYPVALDIEDDSIANLGRDRATDIAYEFCDRVERSGYYVCIYSNLSWFRNNLNMDRLSRFDIWLAQWSNSPTYDGEFGMWQYSSEGSVQGIDGNVDLDISYRDYPYIISSNNLNNVSSGGGAGYFNYEVMSGDTLWDIAERFLGNGTRYVEIQAINGISGDLIYEGQILKIPGKSSQGRTYVVQSGDTLWGIAERFLGDGTRYTEIQALNGISGDIIYEGQVLVLPV